MFTSNNNQHNSTLNLSRLDYFSIATGSSSAPDSRNRVVPDIVSPEVARTRRIREEVLSRLPYSRGHDNWRISSLGRNFMYL